MPTTPTTRRVLAFAAAAALAGGTLTACGDDDGDTAAATEEGGPAAAVEAADDAESSAPATPEVVDGVLTVAMYDYGYRLPESVPVGTKLEVTNESASEVHEVVLFKRADDDTRTIEELLAEGEDALGPPLWVAAEAPGAANEIHPFGEMVLEEPGRYLLVCMIPTGADPEEWFEVAEATPGPPDVPGGPPHVAEGMWAEITVE
jgi:plastocyanin